MYKYWYVLKEDGTIKALYKQKSTPKNGVQITKAYYERYSAIVKSIPNRDGYDKTIHLYPDFTYTVDYTPIEIIEVDGE